MSPEQVDILKAVIAALATLGVAALGLWGVIAQARKPSRDKPPTGDTGKALEQFNGTQNEFMSLVIADNKDLRGELAEVKGTMDDMMDTIKAIRKHNETFLGAVRRYLMKLATAWGGPDPMPWPDDDDFHILEDTLPQKRGGELKRKE